ncbi:MAG: HNH endonuclease signature motif containing protein [Ilumatobacter sp.]|uniref:HNH endonuclease signature motif containing protein n=1 Tax=Ilumatobacter sp. TaxID=1967498 RepID=UPI003C7402D9
MTSGVVDRVGRVTALHASFALSGPRDADVLQAGLKDVAAVRSWAAAMEAAIAIELSAVSSFPEAAIAEASRTSVSAASKTRERADALAAAPAFADALATGSIAAGHADELARALSKLDDEAQRADLFARSERLLGQAEVSTIDTFRRTLSREVNDIQQSDGMERLERQRRATTMSSWTDNDGMWNLRAKFDPLSAVTLSRRIENMVDTLFSEQTPESCPKDPVEKQKHLKALALARLIAEDTRVGRGSSSAGRAGPMEPRERNENDRDGDDGGAAASAAGAAVVAEPIALAAVGRGRSEILAVIDADQPGGSGGPDIDWGLPVEIPQRILSELIGRGDADVVGVVVRNGVVLHAPGELNLGRGARHANRAQRRALRALYATCAVPRCRTHFTRCKIHHIVWWSNGGRTDFDNLLPVCVHHHHKIHDSGWEVALGRNRQLTITLPDGSVMSTGPPNRRAG